MPRKKKPINPILESVAEIRRLELNCEIKLAYKRAKKDLGENFETHMKAVAEEIVALQKSCKPKISYYIAGIMLTVPPADEVVDEESNDDFAFYAMLVKAAIGWGLLNGHADKNNPFVDELREENM